MVGFNLSIQMERIPADFPKFPLVRLHKGVKSEIQRFRKQLMPQLMLSVRSSIGQDNVWGWIPDQETVS